MLKKCLRGWLLKMVELTQIKIDVSALLGTLRERADKLEELLSSFNKEHLQEVVRHLSALETSCADKYEGENYRKLKENVQARLSYLESFVYPDAERREIAHNQFLEYTHFFRG